MFLLDTNVISELRKIKLGRADPKVTKWADTLKIKDLYLSVITVQELEIGILQIERKDSVQYEILRKWLNFHVLPAFSNRILPVDISIAQCSAKLHVPNPKPVRDCLIAATALVHGMTVVTRNIADFKSTGVLLFNPWE